MSERLDSIRRNLNVEEPPYLNGPEDEAWFRCRNDFAWLVAEYDALLAILDGERRQRADLERQLEEARELLGRLYDTYPVTDRIDAFLARQVVQEAETP